MVAERFDPRKDALDRARQGLSLEFGEKVMADGDHLIVPSIRPIDGEERFKAAGRVDGRLYTTVFTRRGETARFICVRGSNAGEERAYRSPE